MGRGGDKKGTEIEGTGSCNKRKGIGQKMRGLEERQRAASVEKELDRKMSGLEEQQRAASVEKEAELKMKQAEGDTIVLAQLKRELNDVKKKVRHLEEEEKAQFYREKRRKVEREKRKIQQIGEGEKGKKRQIGEGEKGKN